MNTHALTAAGLAAILTGLLAHVPETFRLLAFVALAFFVTDTVSGLITAFVCREASSRRLRTQMVSKALQFTILGVLGAGASVLAQTWLFAQMAAGAIITIEALSLLENLARLQEHGGVSLGPIQPVIYTLSHFLAATRPDPTRLVDAQERPLASTPGPAPAAKPEGTPADGR